MKPIDFEFSNGMVGDVPVNRSYGVILSRWQAETWRERISLLLHGRVWLMVKGSTMQPTLISGHTSFSIDDDELSTRVNEAHR
jgi:hypothetical protein